MSVRADVARFRQTLARGPRGERRLVNVPGCWDGLGALMIEQAGFESAFVTGGGLAMARFGYPDMGLVTATELAQTVGVIRERVDLPLIVDADTGFGNAVNLARTVRQLERAGATAIQFEDQTSPKRCGHMAGKGVIPLGEAVGKLKAALDTRDQALIVARTDAVSVEGFEAAMDRAETYLAVGADLLFVEGPRTLEELAEIGRRFGGRVPLVHNLVEGGVSATRSAAVLEIMGFSFALHPLLLLHGFAKAAPRWLAELKAARGAEGLAAELLQLSDMNRMTGADAMVEAGRAYEAAS